jgi:hypothetical protein
MGNIGAIYANPNCRTWPSVQQLLANCPRTVGRSITWFLCRYTTIRVLTATKRRSWHKVSSPYSYSVISTVVLLLTLQTQLPTLQVKPPDLLLTLQIIPTYNCKNHSLFRWLTHSSTHSDFEKSYNKITHSSAPNNFAIKILNHSLFRSFPQ